MKPLSAKASYKTTSLALTAGVTLLVIVLNLVLFGLVDGYGLYLYTATKYEHQLSEGIESFLGDLENKGHEVKIRFCMNEEDLSSDVVYSLVWNTACQLANTFDFIEVDTINLFTNPDEAAKYLYREEINPETGLSEQVKVNLSRQSVIIDGGKHHVVQSLASFFQLDSNQTITAYRGEEVMASGVRYVVTDNHPKAYYTTNHGEKYSLSMLNLLVCAGYEVTPIDLLQEAPEDTDGVVFISVPVYDFVKGGEGVRGEIEKLEEFMQKGGMVIACLDPLTANTKELEALLSRWGITVTHQTVRDYDLSLPTDDFVLVTDYAGGEEAKALQALVQQDNDNRVILREASSLSLSEVEGKTVSPLLLSSKTAKAYKEDKVVSSDGQFTLSALSTNTQNGGGVLVTASYYFTANDALDSNEYGNSDFVYGVLSRYGDMPVPLSANSLRIENRRLENLSAKEARVYTVLLAVVLPLAVLSVGTVLLLRRRRGRRSEG